MTDGARHRHTSTARQVSLPVVTVAAGLVTAAVVVGDVTLLRASAIIALVVVVGIALLFDRELLNDRRAHGLERANLARAYAVEYAGWIEGRQTMTSWPDAWPRQHVAGTDRDAPSDPAHETGVPVIVVATDDAEASDELADAPTVVTMVAWEERLRESQSPAPRPSDPATGTSELRDERRLA